MPAAEITQKELARLIGRTTRQVHNLTEQGVFVRVPSAAKADRLVYPMPASMEAWVAYRLKQEAERGAAAVTDDDRRDAERRKAIADAALRELRLARLRGELVPREEYRLELARVLHNVRAVIDAFPARYASRLPGDGPLADRVALLRAIAREVLAELRGAGEAPESADEAEGAEAETPDPAAA